jgi:hypothetical protein
VVSFPPSLFLFGPEKGILSDVITFVVVLIQFFLRRADLVKLMIFFDKARALCGRFFSTAFPCQGTTGTWPE